MIKNKFKAPCETCKKPAVYHVVAEGFDDAPASFTISRTCSGVCSYAIGAVPAARMHELTGLPLSGWSETTDAI